LRVFHAEHKQDLMVVYNEYAERNDSVRTRAYLVYHNDERVRRHQRPEFINASRSELLSAIPILSEPPDGESVSPDALCVVPLANRFAFAVYSGNREVSSHRLPVYPDHAGGLKQIALTPLAVAADVGLIGAFLWLQSLDSDSCD
jgi:hypothetical protein